MSVYASFHGSNVEFGNWGFPLVAPLSEGGGPDLAFLDTPPNLPSTTKTVTWEAAGDPTSSPVTETTNCWSDDGGTTTYSSLNALIGAQTGDVTLVLPSGDFILTASAVHDVAYSIGIEGQVDGNGVPSTAIQGTAAALQFNTATATADFFVKNIAIGAFQADIDAFDFGANISSSANYSLIQEGQLGIQFVRGRYLYTDNVIIRFTGDDGLGGGGAYAWYESGGSQVGIRHTSKVMLYNTEIYGCGNNNQEHCIYVHDVPLFLSRCKIYDAVGGGHCIKYDGEMFGMYQTYVNNELENFNQPDIGKVIDITTPGDWLDEECLIIGQVGGGATYANRDIMNIGGRRSKGGLGYSKRVQSWYHQDLTTTGVADVIQWSTGGTAPSETYTARVASYAAGTPSVTLKSSGAGQAVLLGTQSSGITNTTTSNYWNAYWGGEVRTATKGDGTTVFTLSSAFTGTPAADDLIMIAPASSGADTPLLRKSWWDSADPDYYFGKINDGTGKLKMTAHADFARWCTKNSMWVRGINESITNGRAITFNVDMARMYVGTSALLADMPAAPLAGTDGTDTWDRAGDGSFSPGQSSDPFLGVEPSSDDYVFPGVFGVAGSSLIIEGGTSTNDGQVTRDSATISETTAQPLVPMVRKITSGNDNEVADPDTTGGNWWPTTAQTTTSSSVAVDATTIPVASITGFSDGQWIQIEYQTIEAGSPCLYVGQISGAPSAGNITVTPAVGAAIASGARVAATAAPGTLPDWFATWDDMWNVRRVA